MNLRKLEEEQVRLAKKVVLKDDATEPKTVGGCDEVYIDDAVIAVIVVLDYRTQAVVDKAYAVQQLKFPYISGFLSYRLAPAFIEAVGKLQKKPDVLMVNANGILHPRRFGLASHLGLSLDLPTLGVAKKLACGTVEEGKVMIDGHVCGIRLQTKEFAKPMYISPGHRITLKGARKVFDDCLRKGKLPEPLRIAHKIANKKRDELMEQKAAQAAKE